MPALQLSIASFVGTIQQLFSSTKAKKSTRVPFAHTLFERGGTVDEVTNNILALLIGTTVELSQSTSQIRAADMSVDVGRLYSPHQCCQLLLAR